MNCSDKSGRDTLEEYSDEVGECGGGASDGQCLDGSDQGMFFDESALERADGDESGCGEDGTPCEWMSEVD